MEKILGGIFIEGLSIYTHKTLIISDIHIGYEEALNMQGILLPRMQFKDIIDSLEKIFIEFGSKRIGKIIINGDLKHEFGRISETEWRHTIRFLDYLGKKAKEIILIKGNHDIILGPIANKRGVKIKEYEIINDILIIHGDKIPEKKLLRRIKTIIIGHEHPAISLQEGPRIEKYKCFLKGKWEKFSLIVLPSFSPVAEGTNILKEDLLSPFLHQNLDDFRVFIVSDKVYDFGKLKNLR